MADEDNKTEPPTEDSPPPVRSRGEKIFLAALLLLTLGAAIGFVLLTILGKYAFPSTMVAFLMGVFVATLAYTFLGGVGGAIFQLGALKLAGAAAVIVGIFFAVKGPLSSDMKDAQLIETGRNTESLVEQERAKAAEERRLRLAAERTAENAGDAETATVTGLVNRIRSSSAVSPLGRGVLDLYRRGVGPFNRVIRTTSIRVRFNDLVPPGTFQYCHGRLGDEFTGPVLFQLIDHENGTAREVTLEGRGDIGPGICDGLPFDAKLGCDAARQLFPDAIGNCPNGDRVMSLTASILNADLLPQSSMAR